MANQSRKVCKNGFMQSFQIHFGKRLERICKLLLENITPTDERSKNTHENAFSRVYVLLYLTTFQNCL